MRRAAVTGLGLLLAFSLALPVWSEEKKADGTEKRAAGGQDAKTLQAIKVKEAPTVDAKVDQVWEKAPALKVKVEDGANLEGGTTEVDVRSVYTGDMVYFLVQYKDPSESIRRAPWQKQEDGSWKKLKDPNDKGGDNNLYYEDKFAFLWDINSPAFAKEGCMSTCHLGEGKPFGNKYIEKEGERVDMWHMKGVRTGKVDQTDDQYVDSTRYDKEKSPNAGRKTDPKTGGGYSDNQTGDKKMPQFALPGNKPAPPYWILESEKVPVEDSKYKKGDEVPGIIIAPFAGDRGDVTTRIAWKDGIWTMEFARKLVTGSEFDVQFDDLKKSYPFGVAVFDNAQVRHAYHDDVVNLVFK